MNYTQVLDKARALSDPRAVAIFNRWAVSEDECIGVGLTKLKKIAKEAKRDHERALLLWDSGTHEGKLLATLTEEPKKVSSEQLDRQVKQIHTFDLSSYFADNIVAKTPFLLEKANDWAMMMQPEMVRRTGYACLVNLAKYSRILDDNYFLKHLTIIEFEIHRAKNWVKEGQNYAIIAIGSRNKTLNAKALELADRLGKIEVDYGDTSCQTSDAREILRSERVLSKI